MTPRRILTIVATTIVVACGDTAGPSPAIEITGPSDLQLIQTQSNDGTPIIACDVTLQAQMTSTRGGDAADWTGARFSWRRAYSTAIVAVDTLDATEARDFWGGNVTVGVPRVAAWRFLAPEPFTVDLAFRYSAGGRDTTTSYQLACQPPAPLPTGHYRLIMVSNHGLPYRVAQWDSIYAATLDFFPNMTYTYSSRVQAWGQIYDQPAGPPRFYGMPTADSLWLPSIAMGTAGGNVYRSANGLVFTELNCCGRPDYVWFYSR